MAAGVHGSARTMPRVRAELQTSQEATRRLAARYGLNPKTVAKWRDRHAKEGAAGLADRSWRPHHGATRLAAVNEDEILVLRRHRSRAQTHPALRPQDHRQQSCRSDPTFTRLNGNDLLSFDG